MSKIPELSFEDIQQEKSESIKSMSSALEDHGFFSVTNHGLSLELLDKCYKSSKDFFNLELNKKIKYHSKSSKGARGYTPQGIETAVGEKIADQKEFWHHGPLIDDSFDPNIPGNLVIDEIKDFNSNFDELYNELHLIGIRIMSAIASSIGLEKDYFYPWINKGNSLLRSIHYPAINNVDNIHRARAHEDINLITLLIGAEEGGLEVLSKNGNWIKVLPSTNSIVCNVGDMLQLVTNKRLKSTRHRVIQYEDQKSKSRYSIPFFLHPAPNVLLKSVFDDKDQGIVADDFLNERLRAINLY